MEDVSKNGLPDQLNDLFGALPSFFFLSSCTNMLLMGAFTLEDHLPVKRVVIIQIRLYVYGNIAVYLIGSICFLFDFITPQPEGDSLVATSMTLWGEVIQIFLGVIYFCVIINLIVLIVVYSSYWKKRDVYSGDQALKKRKRRNFFIVMILAIFGYAARCGLTFYGGFAPNAHWETVFDMPYYVLFEIIPSTLAFTFMIGRKSLDTMDNIPYGVVIRGDFEWIKSKLWCGRHKHPEHQPLININNNNINESIYDNTNNGIDPSFSTLG
ncbi:hypothetical protein SAMD00019534_006410 [Acytostelium subglobosum LB1]|uniref:hypothetical protein n=1 Tax=Acytostelium subglobosum LB1 TaxID=1410327 RepID=UPI000644C8D4|nr:hypothetical protein SAMD00019534_006410 [Acytostelium subglobosum LB1]GAM17466.1 hypothetical protein SAMD00019534_006410 [Acytostelium subglobosum LB1]|eukprot:XP_012759528.1 hypothetical protein SAMD00019534_006410 [Acytostelium subglobosum LB1]